MPEARSVQDARTLAVKIPLDLPFVAKEVKKDQERSLDFKRIESCQLIFKRYGRWNRISFPNFAHPKQMSE
ncbi:hypothetical protein Sjap_004733 [Stephania japonica]|uniref:Uncharacterized protein n=1 Tax=Stephania japonica TaxID=461633 RepID=A0AAP0K3R7_9MAGN